MVTFIVREDYSPDGDAWSRMFYRLGLLHSSIANCWKTFRMSTLVRELLGGAKMALQVYLIPMDCKT
jgi:hypothetical protein